MKIPELAKIFKALSNEQRLKLFKLIYDWQCCTKGPGETISCCAAIDKAFTKACASMNLSRSTISFHLKELENAGLIKVERIGQSSSVRVNEQTILAIQSFM